MNNISTFTYRQKYFSVTMEEVLKRALVAEKICNVDNSDIRRIENPFGSVSVAQMTGITGTYSIGTYTTTDDTLTVNQEVKVPEHIYDFEDILTSFDMFAERMREMMYAAAERIDAFVLNSLTAQATGTYTTPAGGFTNPANINTIISALASRVMGYNSDAYKGMFLVIENTDIVGFMAAQMTSGFSYADAALRNGFMSSYAGVEIYVTRAGTFVTGTIGTVAFTNANRRVFGIKNVATYASPRNLRYTEKEVSGRTGKECLVFGYVGFKLWEQKRPLVVNITLA